MARKQTKRRSRYTNVLKMSISATEHLCRDYSGRCDFYAEHSKDTPAEAAAQIQNLKEFKKRLRQIAYVIDSHLK